MTELNIKFYLINNKQILTVEYIMKNKHVFITLGDKICKDRKCESINAIEMFIAETFIEFYKRGHIK